MSGREPVSYIFVDPGKGWIVIDDDGVRFSGARSGWDESAGVRGLVCGGVMKTLSRRWLKEEGSVGKNDHKKAAPLTEERVRLSC